MDSLEDISGRAPAPDECLGKLASSRKLCSVLAFSMGIQNVRRRKSDSSALSTSMEMQHVRRRKSDSCTLPKMQLHRGRSFMESALLQAMKSNDKRSIRAVVSQARAAGVHKEIVSNALHRVQQIEATEMLLRAIDTAQPEIVKIGLAKARTAGVKQDVILQAERSLLRIEADETLPRPIHSQTLDMVSHTMEHSWDAADVGVDERSISITEKLAFIVDHRRRLKAAMNGKDPDVLCKALGDARRCLETHGAVAEVQLESLITKADTRLVFIRDQATSRDLLVDAVASGSTDKLRHAIEIAKHFEVSRWEVDRAELVLQRAVARNVLQDAMGAKRPSPRALDAAICMAKSAGLSGEQTRGAEELMFLRLLEQARHCGDLQGLQQAISKAAAGGMDESILVDFQRSLSEWQQHCK